MEEKIITTEEVAEEVAAEETVAPAVAEEAEETHEGFTVSLALVDSLPVIFFIGTTVLLAMGITGVPQIIFGIGAAASALAGTGKVLWKLFLGLGLGDIKFLNKMFLPFQISGFMVMLVGAIVGTFTKDINWAAVGKAVISLPSGLCFLAGIGAMGFMGWFRKKYDKATFNTDAKKNWIAQFTNVFAQGMMFLGVFLAR